MRVFRVGTEAISDQVRKVDLDTMFGIIDLVEDAGSIQSRKDHPSQASGREERECEESQNERYAP